VQEAQAKYRKWLLLLLPIVGIFIVGEELLQYEWNPMRVGLFLFFAGFLVYRVVVLVRER
jgi:hypothetical protein